MTHLGALAAALVDGELGHGARERALAHLAGCADCRVEVEQQRQVKTRLAELANQTPSSGLMERLLRIQLDHDAATPPGPVPDSPAELLDPPRRPRRRTAVFTDRSVALGRRAPGGRDDAVRPEPSRPPAGAGRMQTRLRRGGRRAALGGAAAVLLGLTTMVAVAGADEPGPVVSPGVDRFLVEHVTTTGTVPLTDPAVGAAVSVSHRP